ncbi:MAG: OmpH family outer membrane protein, partial [Prosthecobacter sp.]|uniref:OmpH family outer membrane protein n=1 Tax=Prosthecobacter sp. TaxID=1965333 RepID=UPI003BAEBE0D
MPANINIPRLTDKEIAEALVSAAKEVAEICPLKLIINVPLRGHQEVNHELDALPPGSDLELLLAENSVIAPSLHLRGPGNKIVVIVDRKIEAPFDVLRFENNWQEGLSEEQRKQEVKLTFKLTSLCRKNLKAPELDASLLGDPSTAWGKYRNAQAGVLSSLQKTAGQIIVDVARENAEIEKLRSERFEKLESQLRGELTAEREKLQRQHDELVAEIERREKAYSDKEAEFQTKEARYVSRQKQDEQIKQIQAWLENWGLTKGTSRKRWPITAAYITALIVTAGLTIYATTHNYDLLKTTDDLAKLQWWHWVALASKAFFPLAAFTTFMVYFIRWSSSWAKQHSEEEFRNRTRLIDIGRSGWLLEAVRDAHEKKAEIPTDLLRELSRNLFSNANSSEGEI